MKLSSPSIRIGVCPAHFGFVETLAPDAGGRLPRDPGGNLRILNRLRGLLDRSTVPITVIPTFVFAGTEPADIREMLAGIRALGPEPEVILMVGSVDPMNPADEDQFVRTAVDALKIAKEVGISTLCSTSFEAWMNETPEKTGTDYEDAVAQLVKVHLRIRDEADLAHSPIRSWHLEFLRPVEFNTFTNLRRAWDVVKRLNDAIGTNFFRTVVDASHCGDSGLSVEENQRLIREIAKNGALGTFHASAPTTRGCLTTDEGWIETLLATCLETGKLETVIVEAFDHTDEGLAALRAAVPGHGINTTGGRIYDQLITDGLQIVEGCLSKQMDAGVPLTS